MTLKNAINFFESLEAVTSNKSEIKTYQEFIQIITSLETKKLSDTQIQSIEIELDHLNLKSDTENKTKFFRNALGKFETYLKDTYSLTSKEYYTNLSVSLGLLFGVVVGILIGERFERSLGISFGICMGLFIGAFIGRRMDAQAKAAGNIL